MAIRNMRLDGDDILLKKSRPVEAFDRKLTQLLDDMADTLEQQSGAGLAAVQVGILKRLFIVDVGDGIIEFINPEIVDRCGEQVGTEGCLSYPGEWGIVARPSFVRVRAQNRQGNWFEVEGEELFARAVCHEYDHLDGIIYKDRASKMLTADEIEHMHDDEDDEQA